MVSRVVETAFWTDKDVLDNYSPEDKYFFLYLMTNSKTSQVGIYQLPIKVISFELGYTMDAVRVLLERFQDKYNQIIYNQETQEVTVIESLKWTILKGGKPVSDLLEKELTKVKNDNLILETYYNMTHFWETSKRVFDKTIMRLFENELQSRGLLKELNSDPAANENGNEKENVNDNHNVNENDNDNEESPTTIRTSSEETNRNLNEEMNRTTNREEEDERESLERYANYLKENHPEVQEAITPNNIITIYYRKIFGEVHPHIDTQLKAWEKKISKTLILEALSRSSNASLPLVYANKIIENWLKMDVKSYKDVIKLDMEFNK